MRYQVSPSMVADDSIAIGVFNDQLPQAVLNVEQQASISQLLSIAGFDAKAGKVLTQYQLAGFDTKQVILFGLGGSKTCSLNTMRKAFTALGKTISQSNIKKLNIVLPSLKKDSEILLRQAIIALEDANMRRDQLKQNPEKQYWPMQITFVMDGQHENALAEGEVIAEAIKLTRYLGNLPANHCTPIILAQKAQQLAKENSAIQVDVYDEKQIRDLKMGCFLAVAQASTEPPRLIVLRYQGANADAAPIALVGKGVTYDSGGVWLKPRASSEEMKYDMCGAATVLGAIQAAAALKLPINLVGVIPATENMLSGSAVKPGDVVTSMSGQTVEIINTDAEGRLILCDALTFVGRFNPKLVIDIATLTGAIITTLGSEASGLMGNDQALMDALINAGETSGDRVWPLPIWEEYQELLDTAFADMANVGGESAKSITAACFLARFTKDYRWAHLDIAGTAWIGGGNKKRAATGRPIPLLMQFLTTISG